MDKQLQFYEHFAIKMTSNKIRKCAANFNFVYI